ncbi:MAG: thiamine-phosphate kinase [Limnohabitans sp.]|jgi:thiamine-monophosphate kinase|nr:thiamine-phosphate kinase [Limnohabitans sp.]
MREFDLLQQVFQQNVRLPSAVLVPPGDDMAEIATETRSVLLAADSAIEGRHTPFECDPYVLGRKAVLRNVSDVAAMMNARPIATLACVIAPNGCASERIARLLLGLRETAELWGAPMIGGDLATTSSDESLRGLIATVTILAVRRDALRPVITRSSARIGDGIYVTGTIGGAWDRGTGLGKHLDFTPRLRVAHALLESLGDALGAAIDVSDGLGRDLGHIADASRVGMDVDLARVPFDDCVANRSPLEAIADGEDYELVFTARGQVPTMVEGVPITRIGVVTEARPVSLSHASVRAHWNGRVFEIARAGFEHGDANGTVRNNARCEESS